MRRLSLVAFITLFLIAALLPAEKNFIALAVTDGERVAMFSKPSVVCIIDGVAGTFYDKMEVIGLLTFGGVRVNGQEISGFDFVVPSSTVMEFIKAAGVTNELGHADKAFQEGLELFWDQRYSTAIPKFEEVKRLFPEHSEVNRLIQSSQQAIAEGKEKSSFSLWVMLAIVLVILFFIVVIIVVGVTILFIARKRSKAKGVSAGVSTSGASAGGVSSAGRPGGSVAGSSSAGRSGGSPAGSGTAQPSPSYGGATPSADSRGTTASSPSSASASSAAQGPGGAPAFESISPSASNADDRATIDLSRTIAIAPAIDMAPISYGSIKFVSGALAGRKFDISSDGACIGRDSTLSQIVIADGRISKRHLWIGVRDGCVTITDQGSRNGTFVNDPKSQRVTETVLKDGDTVILGESDVARFEYQK